MTSRPSLAVVVGASGGIGRALVEGLVQGGGYDRVVALSRRRPADWPVTPNHSPEPTWIPADILEESTLQSAAAEIAGIGVPTRIIIAAGRLSSAGQAPEKTMRALDLDQLVALFAVNAVGPALVAKHLLPLTPRDRPSLFAALSARVGSIGDNRLGGWYGYRASKAALNMMIRTLAIEHSRSRPLGVCVALHPGTVDTALSAPFQAGVQPGGLFTPRQSASALLATMDRLRSQDTGGFFAWDGSKIPW